MFNSLKKIISPPKLSHDEISDRAEFLYYASAFMLIFSLIIFTTNSLFGTEAAQAFNWPFLIISLMQIPVLWLTRSGFIKTASYSLLTIVWVILTAVSSHVGGIRDEGVFGYMLIIIASGFLLSWRIGIIYTLASIGVLWWLAIIEIHGIIKPEIDNPYQSATDLTSIFILAYIVTYFLNKTRTRALKNALHELNERMRIEKELKKSNESLQISESNLKIVNTLKDRFVTVLAHDLRNTTGTIYSALNNLNATFETSSEKDIRETLHITELTAKNNYELLESLLEWGRIQDFNRSFNPDSFHVRTLIEDVIELHRHDIVKKKLHTHNEVVQDEKLHADRNMIYAVMRNLVSNAIKFTQTGGSITIYSTRNDKYYSIIVKDTGIGIKEGLLGKLLTPEYNKSTPGTYGEQGAGIGLIMSNEYILLHSGSLSISSEEGKGTTVCINFPITRASR